MLNIIKKNCSDYSSKLMSMFFLEICLCVDIYRICNLKSS